MQVCRCQHNKNNSTEDLAVNPTHLARVQDALARILNDQDLNQDRKALRGWRRSVFACLQRGSIPECSLECGGFVQMFTQLFSHDINYSARARIPILETHVTDIMARDFAKPAKFPRTITIAVDRMPGRWHAKAVGCPLRLRIIDMPSCWQLPET